MPKLLGQILMESGMITIDDLDAALEIQKSTGRRLGDILIDNNVLTPEELELTLEFQEE